MCDELKQITKQIQQGIDTIPADFQKPVPTDEQQARREYNIYHHMYLNTLRTTPTAITTESKYHKEGMEYLRALNIEGTYEIDNAELHLQGTTTAIPISPNHLTHEEALELGVQLELVSQMQYDIRCELIALGYTSFMEVWTGRWDTILYEMMRDTDVAKTALDRLQEMHIPLSSRRDDVSTLIGAGKLLSCHHPAVHTTSADIVRSLEQYAQRQEMGAYRIPQRLGLYGIVTGINGSQVKLSKQLSRYMQKYGFSGGSKCTQLLVQATQTILATRVAKKYYVRVSTDPKYITMLGELRVDYQSCFGRAGENYHHTEHMLHGHPSFVVLVSEDPTMLHTDMVGVIADKVYLRYWGMVVPINQALGNAVIISNPYTDDHTIHKRRFSDSITQHIFKERGVKYRTYDDPATPTSADLGVWGNDDTATFYQLTDDSQNKLTPTQVARTMTQRKFPCPLCDPDMYASTPWSARRISISGDRYRDVCCGEHQRQQHREAVHECIGCQSLVGREQSRHSIEIYLPSTVYHPDGRHPIKRRVMICKGCIEHTSLKRTRRAVAHKLGYLLQCANCRTYIYTSNNLKGYPRSAQETLMRHAICFNCTTHDSNGYGHVYLNYMTRDAQQRWKDIFEKKKQPQDSSTTSSILDSMTWVSLDGVAE